MLTYTGQRNIYGQLTNNSTTTNLALGDTLMNSNIKYLIQKFNLNERTKTALTVAGTQFYTFPYNYKRLINVTITVGSYTWSPKEITSRRQWDILNMTSVSSDAVLYYYIYNNQVGFFPKPATSNNMITYSYKIRTRDLSQADYTTPGTVTMVNNSTAVTGSSTTFLADMVGRWLQVTAPSGDNEWYKIATFVSTTSITLESPYNGLGVSGASFTIGEVSILPEEFQDLPYTYALRQYFSSRVKDADIFQMYKVMYDERYTMMNNELGSKDDNMVIDSGDFSSDNPINPNLYITLP